ncbi:LptF/LptG family permease [Desulfurobacterium sp.]|uniref:LptF/LptG family permease n=1 Tax=Desulfurobacterium sp. TaxID=2004706 RepID=UPI0026051AAC|nr:LptF/LptG family permease [Desulfurobacterium sp.]
MFKKLDVYAFKRLLKYFLLIFSVLIILFLIIDFVGRVDQAGGGHLKDVLLLVLSRLPIYTVRMLPVAVLVSVMVTVADFSSTNELLVIKSLGISLYRFSLPFIIFSFIVSVFAFSVEEVAVPAAAKVEKQLLISSGKRKPLIIGAQIWSKLDDKFISIEKLNFADGEGKHFSMIKLNSDFKPVGRTDALSIKYLGNNEWMLKNVYVRDFSKNLFHYFEELKVNLKISLKGLKVYSADPEKMELFSLIRMIRHLKALGYNITTYEVELYNKIALPLVSIVATLIGIPLGAFNPRNQKGYTAAVAIGITVLMWITISFFNSLGKSGVLPPLYASFAPEAIFFSLGLILFSRSHT